MSRDEGEEEYKREIVTYCGKRRKTGNFRKRKREWGRVYVSTNLPLMTQRGRGQSWRREGEKEKEERGAWRGRRGVGVRENWLNRFDVPVRLVSLNSCTHELRLKSAKSFVETPFQVSRRGRCIYRKRCERKEARGSKNILLSFYLYTALSVTLNRGRNSQLHINFTLPLCIFILIFILINYYAEPVVLADLCFIGIYPGLWTAFEKMHKYCDFIKYKKVVTILLFCLSVFVIASS